MTEPVVCCGQIAVVWQTERRQVNVAESSGRVKGIHHLTQGADHACRLRGILTTATAQFVLSTLPVSRPSTVAR